MNLPEGIEFHCGNCVWMQKVTVPKEKQKDYPLARGYCTFEPPRVFPMPQQQSNLKDIQGQTKMGMAPFMIRPVVEEGEPPCGRYAPDTEMLAIIKEAQPEEEILCGGKGCGGNCGC